LSKYGLPDGGLGVGPDQVSHLIAEGWLKKGNGCIVTHGGILLV